MAPYAVTVVFDTEEEVEDLYGAILSARAAQLTEVRSQQIQAVAYQDRPRGAMAGRTADTAQRRYDVLSVMAEALREWRRKT